MELLGRIARALPAGAAAGLAALAVDQLSAILTLGHPVPLGGRFVLAYAALGAVLGLAVEVGSHGVFRQQSDAAPRGWTAVAGTFAPALALVWAPAIFERVHHALGSRTGHPAALAAAALVTAAYGLWILLLRRIAGPGGAGPLWAALTAAAGLAVNRNLVDYPLQPTALAADAAVLAAGLALAWATRTFGGGRVSAAVAAAALAALLFSAGASWPPGTPATGGGDPRRPHLVLVVIDTLRQDVFEAVLEETAEGRAFREAVDGAAWFTQAIAAAPWTVPSIGTLMTGLHPREHGFRGAETGDRSRPLTPLHEAVPTLAEQLRERGYRTEALGTNGFLQPVSGISRGFARYEILSGPTVKLPPLTALARLGLVPKMAYQQASSVRRRLGQRLGPMTASGRPLFVWLHVMEPHSPLLPHRGLSPDPAGEILEPRERLYRDEVRFALAELRRMLQLLRDHGVWDETLLIVVSDHGEMFPSDGHFGHRPPATGGEPGTYGHGHALYEELVRVPLVIRPPGGLPEDRRISALTSHADVYATIVDLLARDLSPPGRERSSLAPWLGSAPPDPPPPGRSYALVGAVQRGPEQRALRTPTLKLIDFPRSGRPSELYLIAEDPRERRDVSRRHLSQLAAATRELELRWSRLGEAPGTRPAAFDAETLERLEALGYVP